MLDTTYNVYWLRARLGRRKVACLAVLLRLDACSWDEGRHGDT